MRGPVYTLSDLFKQLGLPADPKAIADFIERHQGACGRCTLAQSPIWTESQKNFLQEAIAQDADWAQPAETLTSLLSRSRVHA
jgi:Protein of unknown function (DUF2789)